MNQEEKFSLISRNTEEILTEEKLRSLFKKDSPVVYCGYELSGDVHLGNLVTIMKLIDFHKAGFKVKVLFADIHSLLNKKGSEEEIRKWGGVWKKTLKALGLKCDIVMGSKFQFKKDYELDVMTLAQNTSINRGLRSMQEIARDFQNATISQLLYPLMQVVDIKHLKADVALGGLEQRKVHMIGKDMEKVLGLDFVAVHTPLISSLKGEGGKMSKSIPGSAIGLRDSQEEIKKIIAKAYCPERKAEGNPILQICRLVILPKFSRIILKRKKEFGGDINYAEYKNLEDDFVKGSLHPADLKNTLTEYLEKIIAPVRKSF